ncbi:phosphoribosylanthranilate isomerase [Methanospirillum sp.]|uniref:phosphoribosylanthranilate isomerase n=1 Tax=Methanospirillum sp. TaxID=45200 RepID=UPI002D1FB323|nr:phosphoribosylanthranilate isomerase [Methanospirillum sp.]
MTRPEDARLADRAGADAIGVVLFSDSPRSVSVAQASDIFRAAGPYMGRVCVSHTSSPGELREILALQPTAIQISHPHILPASRPYQVIRVIRPGDPIPSAADAVIVDASMGRGVIYDHEYSKTIISMSKIPVILAGGLTPENIRDAVRLRPYAVDVASGVESSPGIKDAEKVMAFVKNAREASHAA